MQKLRFSHKAAMAFSSLSSGFLLLYICTHCTDINFWTLVPWYRLWPALLLSRKGVGVVLSSGETLLSSFSPLVFPYRFLFDCHYQGVDNAWHRSSNGDIHVVFSSSLSHFVDISVVKFLVLNYLTVAKWSVYGGIAAFGLPLCIFISKVI